MYASFRFSFIPLHIKVAKSYLVTISDYDFDWYIIMDNNVAGWCSGWGLCFVIQRSQVRILITSHVAGGGELSAHRP